MSQTFLARSGDDVPTTRMATALAPVNTRDVVRCDFCGLPQFIALNRFLTTAAINKDGHARIIIMRPETILH